MSYGYDFSIVKAESLRYTDAKQRLIFLETKLNELNKNHPFMYARDYERNDYEAKLSNEIGMVKKMIIAVEPNYFINQLSNSFFNVFPISNQETLSMENEQNKTDKPAKGVEPIRWLGTDRQLIYLINELESLNLISHGNQQFKLIKQHFCKKDNTPFTDSLKKNANGMFGNKGTGKNTKGKPKGQQKIDTVVKKVKDLK